MQDITIAKFGGTSVSSKETIGVIASLAKKGSGLVIVVSALTGVTDILLSLASEKENRAELFESFREKHTILAKQVLSEKSRLAAFLSYTESLVTEIKHILTKEKTSLQRTDHILSYGEILSSRLLTDVLQEEHVRAEQVIATALLVTDETFGNAEFLPSETKEKVLKNLSPLLESNSIPVVTGFIGATKKGNVTTLGRGGSDYSAAILGLALSAKEIQIWTDVSGIYTTDPRLIKTAQHIKSMSYREAAELAAFGAKVLHPKTISPAIHAGILVSIRNTFHPEHKGTRIEETPPVKPRFLAISAKKQVVLITLVSSAMLFSKGFMEKIFHIFTLHNLSIDLVSVSEVSVSVTLDTTTSYEQAIEELKKFTTVTVREDVGIVALIGHEIVRVDHLMRKVFRILDKKYIPIEMISLGATDINISLVLPEKNIKTAVMTLHEKVLLSKKGKKK